ncbi:MAG: Fur family transcriptional regulator [Peptoniphilaceae bacterium]
MQNLLRKYNLKVTKARIEILNLLSKSDEALNAKFIYETIRKEYNISLSTVYRTLNQLEELSILNKTLQQNGLCYYEMSNSSHKHYVSCIKCGSVSSIELCPIDKYEEDISNETGFEITGHNIEFKGICPKCQE